MLNNSLDNLQVSKNLRPIDSKESKASTIQTSPINRKTKREWMTAMQVSQDLAEMSKTFDGSQMITSVPNIVPAPKPTKKRRAPQLPLLKPELDYTKLKKVAPKRVRLPGIFSPSPNRSKLSR